MEKKFFFNALFTMHAPSGVKLLLEYSVQVLITL